MAKRPEGRKTIITGQGKPIKRGKPVKGKSGGR